MTPILKEYHINPSFANAGALNSKQDTIYFGIPLLGMYIFKYWQYLVFNILTYLIVIILLIKLYISFRITFISTLKFAGNIFLFSLMSLICGVAISYLICLCTGQKFDPINLKYFELDYLVAKIGRAHV